MFKTLLFLTVSAVGMVPGTAMKNTGELVKMSCLPASKNLQWKSDQYEMRDGKGNRKLDDSYKAAVLQIMAHIARVSGDLSLLKSPITVEQHRGGRHGSCFNYTPGGRVIQLVSGCSKSGEPPQVYAAKHFVHELGHLVGQTNGNYAKYFRRVTKPCMISSYGVNNTNKMKRNEEFADVFRAVVFDLERVREVGGSCGDAADFFKDLLKLDPSKLKSQGCT
jgi:hypothetical protein